MMMNSMTMTMPTQMEILAMARELLLDRYLEEKAKILYQWQAMNNWTWQTTGTTMAFPGLPEYPSQDEILALARHLRDYFAEVTQSIEPPTVIESPFEPAAPVSPTQ